MTVFYANSFSLSFGEDAFSITFSFTNEEMCEGLCVVLSPKGAKTLAKTLTEKVAEYEETIKEVGYWKEKKNSRGNRLALLEEKDGT